METKNNWGMISKTLSWLNLEKHYEVPPHSPGGGGLLLIWKKDIEVSVTNATQNYIDTMISHKGISFQSTFVYGEPDQAKRFAVWNEITTLHPAGDGAWFLTGDFNEIIDNGEKSGGVVRAEGTFCAFRSFLSHNDLFDVKHHGNFLSWRGVRNLQVIQCRLDRALCNSKWSDFFPSCRSQYMKFEGLDHRPLLSFLDTSRRKGQKIFRFDRRLRDNIEVKQIIKDIWESTPYLHVEEKLSLCRRAICKWSKKFYENSRKTLDALRERLEAAMIDPIHNEEVIFQINKELLHNYRKEEEFWKQRSRQLWLILGDSNSFFHSSTKARQARNRLSVIEDENGIPCFEEEQITEVICKFYKELFTSAQRDGSDIVKAAITPCISQQTNEELIRPPSPEEIREATFAIHPDKAPGPDGFSASFFQANWEVIGPAVIQEIQCFFASGHLRISQNETHVRLIPKHTGAKSVGDYRPIALCNVFFKIISKMLSIRLKPVLETVISENQSAFTSGRAISDNVLITHEVLQYLKTSQATVRCTMAVKTDMSKVYDRVEWKFLDQVMRGMGFHEIWINWIIQCISTMTYSYLINDTAQGSVTPQRGIRQGDPLSPYLFIICGEVLSGLCSKAKKEGSLRGVKVARHSPAVNHLLFADDTMFFCQATLANCQKLQSILL